MPKVEGLQFLRKRKVKNLFSTGRKLLVEPVSRRSFFASRQKHLCPEAPVEDSLRHEGRSARILLQPLAFLQRPSLQKYKSAIVRDPFRPVHSACRKTQPRKQITTNFSCSQRAR
jgi:hypothetical protein